MNARQLKLKHLKNERDRILEHLKSEQDDKAGKEKQSLDKQLLELQHKQTLTQREHSRDSREKKQQIKAVREAISKLEKKKNEVVSSLSKLQAGGFDGSQFELEDRVHEAENKHG